MERNWKCLSSRRTRKQQRPGAASNGASNTLRRSVLRILRPAPQDYRRAAAAAAAACTTSIGSGSMRPPIACSGQATRRQAGRAARAPRCSQPPLFPRIPSPPARHAVLCTGAARIDRIHSNRAAAASAAARRGAALTPAGRVTDSQSRGLGSAQFVPRSIYVPCRDDKRCRNEWHDNRLGLHDNLLYYPLLLLLLLLMLLLLMLIMMTITSEE